MSKIIACVNEKGGVAKTTTIKNLAIGLAARGKKVLAIDLDPSANLTTALGIHVTKEQKTILDIFKLSKDCEDVPEGYAIMQHEEGIDVICSVKELHAFESELICAIQRAQMWKCSMSATSCSTCKSKSARNVYSKKATKS